MAQTSLEVIIAGKDNLTPTLKKVESGLGKVNSAAKSLGSTLAAGFAMGAGIAGFQGFVSVLDKAVSAIPGFINQGIAFGETIDFITDATGASSEAASRFAGQVQYTTGSLDGIVQGLRAATKEITTNAAEWERLGVEVHNADGTYRDTVSIIEDARQVIQALGPGAAASAKMIDLLGRSGLNMADYMNLSAEQAALLNAELERMGYIIPDATVFEAAKRELNLWDMAWQGLSATLTASVLPALRQVLAGITEAVITYGPQIKAVLADIINYISGIVSGLTGLNIAPFQQQMDALATTTGGTVLSFEAWATANGKVIPTIKAATGGTNALTDALNKQSAALDKQIAKIKASDDAMERSFQRTMGRLADAVGDQITALDAAEKQRDIDRQRAEYAKQLAEARRDLAKILTPDEKGVVDIEAVREARQRIQDIIDTTNEWERSLTVGGVRDALEQVKTYIEDIARLEAEATNKPALLKNLATRQKVLEEQRAAALARGDMKAVAAYDAKLEAIRTATARTQEAIRAGDRIRGFEDQKAKIAEVLAAQVGANATANADTTKTLEELKKQYKTYVDETKTKLAEAAWAMNNVNLAAFGFPEGTTIPKGATSPLSQAFIDGKAAAEEFRKTLEDIAGVAAEFASFLGDAVEFIASLGNMKLPEWVQQLIDGLTVPGRNRKMRRNPETGVWEWNDEWSGGAGSGNPKQQNSQPLPSGGSSSIQGEGSAYAGAAAYAGAGMVVNTVVTIDGEVLGRQVDKYLARRGRV